WSSGGGECASRDCSGGPRLPSPATLGRALPFLQPDGGAQLLDVAAQVVAFGRDVGHEVGEAVGDGVELVLGGLGVARLAVLKEGDEQEGHDRGRRIYEQLP